MCASKIGFLAAWLLVALAGLYHALLAFPPFRAGHADWVKTSVSDFAVLERNTHKSSLNAPADLLWSISSGGKLYVVIGDMPKPGAWLIPVSYNYRNDIVRNTEALGFFNSFETVEEFYENRIWNGFIFFIIGMLAFTVFYYGWSRKKRAEAAAIRKAEP